MICRHNRPFYIQSFSPEIFYTIYRSIWTATNKLYVESQQKLLSFHNHYQVINNDGFWTLETNDKHRFYTATEAIVALSYLATIR